MPSYVLRIEAVNISRFAWDTADLSTIRGSSLLLLQWPRKVEKWLSPGQADGNNAGIDVSTITSGGSSVTFVVSGESLTADCIKGRLTTLLRELRKEGSFQLCMFAGAAAEITENGPYGRALQVVIASIRRQQSCQADANLPALNEDADNRSFCALNRVLASSEKTAQTDAGRVRIADSVHIRREYGIQNRGELIKALTGANVETTDSFQELSSNCEAARRGIDVSKDLNGHMAVLVIDGNRFGEIDARKSGTSEEHRAWDSGLQNARQAFLNDLVNRASRDIGRWHTPRGKLRFETLVWGGDEQVWVVPAWVGLELLSSFFQFTKKPEWQSLDKPQRITHCAGIVLCHANAPIRDAVALADRLMETAKRQRGRLPDLNAFCCQVLESFDHLGESFDHIRSLQRPYGMTERETVICHGALDCLLRARRELNLDLDLPATRRQRIQRAVLAQDPQRLSAEIDRLIQVAGSGSPVKQVIGHHIDEWRKLFLRNRTSNTEIDIVSHVQAFWFYLLELWDYLLSAEPSTEQRTKTLS